MIKLFGIPIIIAIIALVVLTIYLWGRVRFLKRKIASLNNPVLALPRDERRAWAREQLERDQEAYELVQQEKLMEVIAPERRKAYHPTHNEGITN